MKTEQSEPQTVAPTSPIEITATPKEEVRTSQSCTEPTASGTTSAASQDVVIVVVNDYKIATTNPEQAPPLKVLGDHALSPKGKKAAKKPQPDFENMLYFVCNLCPYLCIEDAKITEHLENDHQTKTAHMKTLQLKCPACPNIFSHKMSLSSHLVHDHLVDKSDLRMIIQAVHYSSQKHAREEEANAAPIETATAEIIIAKSPALNETDQNSTNNDNSDDMSLKICIEETPLPVENKIKLDPEVVQIIKCSVPACKIRLQSEDHMRYHIRCHHGATFHCPECAETFTVWKPLAGHLWRLHKIDMGLYTCEKCGYKCASRGRLNSLHKLTHGEQKNFECDVCQKSFKNRQQLRNHKITHREKSKRAPHHCDRCSKVFFNKRQLRLHVSGVHEKLKPFQCSYCEHKVASRSALKGHMRQHTGEKPFQCDQCYYMTADHNSLRRHKLRHTGEKPYKCTLCDYACIQSNTYKVHLKTKHPGLEKDFVFTCTDCQYRSVSRDLYNVHMQVVHKQKADG